MCFLLSRLHQYLVPDIFLILFLKSEFFKDLLEPYFFWIFLKLDIVGLHPGSDLMPVSAKINSLIIGLL